MKAGAVPTAKTSSESVTISATAAMALVQTTVMPASNTLNLTHTTSVTVNGTTPEKTARYTLDLVQMSATAVLETRPIIAYSV